MTSIDNALIQKLPQDIILSIISYSYNYQSKILCNDIIHFHKGLNTIMNMYIHYWIDEWDGTIEDVYVWLAIDLVSFINKNVATIYGLVDYFYEVCMRNPFMKNYNCVNAFYNKIINTYDILSHPYSYRMNNSRSIFFTLWGLLTIKERNQFIEKYGFIYNNNT